MTVDQCYSTWLTNQVFSFNCTPLIVDWLAVQISMTQCVNLGAV